MRRRPRRRRKSCFTVAGLTVLATVLLGAVLFFVWQEATELAESDAVVEVQEELQTKGFRYSGLRIKEK